MNCAPFDVYAIRYARHSGRIAADNYLGKVDFHDAESDLDYYVWALRRGDEVYVVDTGFAEDAARQRGRELLMRPAQGLALIGIDATQVRDVILTHLHYDHAGTLGDFPPPPSMCRTPSRPTPPGAACAMGRCATPTTSRTWSGSCARSMPAGSAFTTARPNWRPGCRCTWSAATPAACRSCASGRSAAGVLASDASHLYGNIGHDAPFPAVYHVGDMLEGYHTVRRLADSEAHIVPGHDPQVMQRYPAPSPELHGKVVRLDVAPTPDGLVPEAA